MENLSVLSSSGKKDKNTIQSQLKPREKNPENPKKPTEVANNLQCKDILQLT